MRFIVENIEMFMDIMDIQSFLSSNMAGWNIPFTEWRFLARKIIYLSK